MIAVNKKQEKLRRQVLNPWKFGLFLFSQLPLGLIAGLRLNHLDQQKCVASVPFNRLTKNPFRSMYFAVQSMAAELSTAAGCLMAVQGHRPSIAFIIVGLKARFLKKASGRVFFTCEEVQHAFEAVEKCLKSGEPETATFQTTGKTKDGTVVAEFEITWSFKQRRSQVL